MITTLLSSTYQLMPEDNANERIGRLKIMSIIVDSK